MKRHDAVSDPTTVPTERVREILERHADNPSAFLALNKGNSYFHTDRHDGVIVYRRSGRYLVQFGGPFAAPEDSDSLLSEFAEFARSRRRKIVGIQLQEADARQYASAGFTVNQIGASYAIDLSKFTLRGGKFMQLRNKISRARRAGLEVKEVQQRDWAEPMQELDASWLRSKGKHAKPLEFLVGEYGGAMQPHRRLFIGLLDGKLAGYISYSPVYGSRPGWLHDLSRRIPDGPPGVMEAINSTAIETFSAEEAGWLHFGFTPFTGLETERTVPEGSRPFAWLVGQLARRGAAVYPAATQLAYKEKWSPQAVIPEYIAFSGRASLSGLLHVFKAANAL